MPQTALKLIHSFRSCDASQRSCQKWVGKNGFWLLFHYMQWSGSISYLNHFSPKLQISYEENKCQKRIFWIEATKFLSFESFKIERSLKLCIQDGHATPHHIFTCNFSSQLLNILLNFCGVSTILFLSLNSSFLKKLKIHQKKVELWGEEETFGFFSPQCTISKCPNSKQISLRRKFGWLDRRD